MSENQPPPAINPMPPIVTALFLIIAAVELGFMLGGFGLFGGQTGSALRSQAIESYGVNTMLAGWMLENQSYPLEHLARFVSYSFIHASTLHAAVACALFLAMGKMVGSVFSAVSVLLVFGLSAAIGAVAFCLVLPEGGWLFGAYPGIYGLIGAYTFLMWVTLKAQNGRPSQAFSLIAMLLAIQLVFGIVFGNNYHWVAELVGFLTGFSLSFFLIPGGFKRVLEFLRR